MSAITLVQPRRLLFGPDALTSGAEDAVAQGCRRVLVLTSRSTRRLAEPLVTRLASQDVTAIVDDRVTPEPTVALFDQVLQAAQEARVDGVIGVGGGSVLDVAKLIAALVTPPVAAGAPGQPLHASRTSPPQTLPPQTQTLADVIGIGKLSGRRAYLACAPTTAGTGSEASPNAILLDEEKRAKVAVISPWLVPDAAVVDPTLMVSMPPAITATTGLDALAHCIEAYTNRFAHPLVDHYALEGIRLGGLGLPRAVANGKDLEARTLMARASLYGGICLGPVNTAAAHALAYPLGSEFGVAHGLAIALLLASVMEFNLEETPERHARIAIALGVKPEPSDDARTIARAGVARVRELVRTCGLPSGLGAIGISAEAVPDLARGALAVTRLLKNNPRALSQVDAEAIYRASWGPAEAAA